MPPGTISFSQKPLFWPLDFFVCWLPIVFSGHRLNSAGCKASEFSLLSFPAIFENNLHHQTSDDPADWHKPEAQPTNRSSKHKTTSNSLRSYVPPFIKSIVQ